MPLQSSLPIDLQDVYGFASANGYTGGNDLDALLSWSGWSNLPVGADSLADFLGVTTATITELVRHQVGDNNNLTTSNHAIVKTDANHIVLFWSNSSGLYAQMYEIVSENMTLVGLPNQLTTQADQYADAELISDKIILLFRRSGSIQVQLVSFNTTTGLISLLGTSLEILTSNPFDPSINVLSDSLAVASFNAESQSLDIDLSTDTVSIKGTALDILESRTYALKIDGSHILRVANGMARLIHVDAVSGNLTELASVDFVETQPIQMITLTAIKMNATRFLLVWTGELPESDPYRWGFNRLINVDIPGQQITTIGPIHSFYDQPTNTIQETAGFLFSTDTVAMVSYTYYFGTYVQLISIDPSTGAPSQIADLNNHPRSHGVGYIPFDSTLSVWAGGDYPDDSAIGLIKITNT